MLGGGAVGVLVTAFLTPFAALPGLVAGGIGVRVAGPCANTCVSVNNIDTTIMATITILTRRDSGVDSANSRNRGALTAPRSLSRITTLQFPAYRFDALHGFRTDQVQCVG